MKRLPEKMQDSMYKLADITGISLTELCSEMETIIKNNKRIKKLNTTNLDEEIILQQKYQMAFAILYDSLTNE